MRPDEIVSAGVAPVLPADLAELDEDDPRPTTGSHRGRSRKLGFVFWICVGWLGVLLIGAIFASVLPLDNPNTGSAPFLLPSPAHPLGTDSLGRDLLSRVVYGSRISLVVGFGSIIIGLLGGGLLGLVAGFVRGIADTLMSAIAYVSLTFPALILLLGIVAFLGANLADLTITIGILSIAPIFRVVRGSTVAFAEREFVTAAQVLGATRRRMLFREILPNVAPLVLSYSLVFAGVSILTEAALAYLGLSVPLPTATWGQIVSSGQIYLSSDPYICLWPSLALLFTILALNLVGDRLRTIFDVREANL